MVSFETRKYLKNNIAVIAVNMAIIIAGARAQTGASVASLDLNAPVLKVHATIPQMQLPQVPGGLLSDFSRAQVMASEESITSDKYVYNITEMTEALTTADVKALYRSLTCFADAVVVGRTTASASHLNASGTGIYTDLDFIVDSVVKNNTQSQLNASQHIVIARPGGILLIGTGSLGTAEIRDGAYPALSEGVKYLLFLSFITESGGYYPSEPMGNSKNVILEC